MFSLPESPSSASPSSSASSSSPSPSPSTRSQPALIKLDLLLRVLQNTFLHPFIAWLLPLCLRAQATPYSHPSFLFTTLYATLLTLLVLASAVNRRLAYGQPRNVNFAEEVVLITGGASGIGKIIAEIYGMRGVSVAVLDIMARTMDGVGSGEEGVEEEMSNVRYYRCDVGDRTQLEDIAKRVEEDLGRPTILINCVAAPINGLPILSLTEHAVRSTIQSNLLSYFHTLQVFLPGILTSRTGGTIVTVSSVLSYLTAAGLADYTATKAAVSAVHRTLEAELRLVGAEQRVKTILVETGQVATQLFENVETPNRFFAPVLEPVEVAREIVSLVDSGNGGLVRLPTYAAFVGLYGILPASIQRLARYFSGIDKAIRNATFFTESEKTKNWSVWAERYSESEVESENSDE
ncbi:hypothetical protein VTO42DRAFT_2092 [Malbranchea cinnamomea]